MTGGKMKHDRDVGEYDRGKMKQDSGGGHDRGKMKHDRGKPCHYYRRNGDLVALGCIFHHTGILGRAGASVTGQGQAETG